MTMTEEQAYKELVKAGFIKLSSHGVPENFSHAGKITWAGVEEVIKSALADNCNNIEEYERKIDQDDCKAIILATCLFGSKILPARRLADEIISAFRKDHDLDVETDLSDMIDAGIKTLKPPNS